MGEYKPPAWEDFQKLVDAGEIDEFVSQVIELGLDLQPHHERFRQLREAVRKLDGCPAGLIDMAFDHALRFDLALLMRYEMQADHLMSAEEHLRVRACDEPTPMTKAWLDRVERIQDRLIWMSEKYARIQHLIALRESQKPRDVQKLEDLRETLRVVAKEVV